MMVQLITLQSTVIKVRIGQSNAPNATSISLFGSTVNSTEDYLLQAFRSVEGFSKIGFYTGSGNQQFKI